MDVLIGITEQRLADIIAEATMRGYEQCRRDMTSGNNDEYLKSKQEIISFLYPNKPICNETFNRMRRRGVFGDAVNGTGENLIAKKSELLEAIDKYNKNQL